MDEDDTFLALKLPKVRIWFDTSLCRREYREEVENRLDAFSQEHFALYKFPTEKEPAFAYIGRDWFHCLIMMGIELQSHRADYDCLLPFIINYDYGE